MSEWIFFLYPSGIFLGDAKAISWISGRISSIDNDLDKTYNIINAGSQFIFLFITIKNICIQKFIFGSPKTREFSDVSTFLSKIQKLRHVTSRDTLVSDTSRPFSEWSLYWYYACIKIWSGWHYPNKIYE